MFISVNIPRAYACSLFLLNYSFYHTADYVTFINIVIFASEIFPNNNLYTTL